jgi:hypothetical protein
MKHSTSIILSLLCPAGILLAGEPVPSTTSEPNNGDWCTWLQSKPGTLYKNAENPWISLVQVGGRFQWQAAYVDGEDVNGLEYDDTYDEYRRVRLESKVDLLRYFSINAKINLVNDGRRSGNELDWGYDSYDELVFSFDIKKAFDLSGFETVKLNYGRHKFNVSEEVHQSSKEILTVERSAIANKVYGANSRPTGVTLDLVKGPWTTTLGLFSGDDEAEAIGNWNHGEAYYASVGYQYNDQWRFVWDHVQNNAAGGQDFAGYEWVSSLAAVYEQDRFGMVINGLIGDNGDTENGNANGRQGGFGGVVLMPWYWVVPEKLQAVARYQYQASSDEEGIRLNSRYVRSSHDNAAVDVNSGRGDEHHSVYLGLNYYLCGDNAKIMGGVEYDHLETPDGPAESMSYFVAFRTFF